MPIDLGKQQLSVVVSNKLEHLEQHSLSHWPIMLPISSVIRILFLTCSTYRDSQSVCKSVLPMEVTIVATARRTQDWTNLLETAPLISANASYSSAEGGCVNLGQNQIFFFSCESIAIPTCKCFTCSCRSWALQGCNSCPIGPKLKLLHRTATVLSHVCRVLLGLAEIEHCRHWRHAR